MPRPLVIKVTCGADDPERSNQGLTVAATATTAGAEVSLWLTGEGAWLGVAGRETFGWAPRGRTPPATVTVNLGERAGEPTLDLILALDSHGTHVAGIAAAHDLYGVSGFDGVAPGAQLLALKISDRANGSVSGHGSILAAIRYAIGVAATRRGWNRSAPMLRPPLRGPPSRRFPAGSSPGPSTPWPSDSPRICPVWSWWHCWWTGSGWPSTAVWSRWASPSTGPRSRSP